MIALLIDIGNSRIKWRIARIDPAASTPRWLTDRQALASNDGRGIANAFAAQANAPVDTVLCSNVAGDDVEAVVLDAVARTWRGALVHRLHARDRQCGVVNGYRDPTRLGADRWLAMIGAHDLFPAQPLLVCSFGTATTIDLLLVAGDGGRFVGGLILPGLDAMRDALVTRTARLPLARGRAMAFADNTDDAITSGIIAAQAGAVERAWRDATDTVGTSADRPVRCVLTGGNAAKLAPPLIASRIPVTLTDDLVLQGMAAVAREIASDAVTGRQALSCDPSS